MAITRFRRSFDLTTVFGTLFTVPEGKELEATVFQVNNIDSTTPEPVSVEATLHLLGTNLNFRAANRVIVAGRDGYSPIAGLLMLSAGDQIQGGASANGDAQLLVVGYLKDVAT